MKKLNLGCGKDIRKGYINLDIFESEGVDVIYDLNKIPYPFPDNHFEEVLVKGILEFMDDLLKILEELYRICKSKAIIEIRVPAFPSPYSAQNLRIKNFFSYTTFESFKKDGGNDTHFYKPEFKTLERRFIYSYNPKLRWINFFVNIFPKFYSRFLFNIFPSDGLYFKLEVVK